MFKANSPLNLLCPRQYVGRGPDTMIVGDVLRTVSIWLLMSLFSVSVCPSLVSLAPAWTCRTIKSQMITALRYVSQRGAKRFRVEISKTGGGEVVARGLDRVFRCCTQGPWFPGAGVKDIWQDRVPGARGLCRETHGVEVVGVLAARCILTLDL